MSETNPLSPVSPAALVRWVLRSGWDGAALEALHSLSHAGPAAWEGAARLARAEGVAPLVYHRLRHAGIAPPVSGLGMLRAAYYRAAQRSLQIARDLEALLTTLEAARVPTILLKGAALAHTVYPNPAVRPMGDIDLLIHPGDLPAALAALGALGYRSTSPEAHAGDVAAFENELLLQRAEPEHLPAELHWSLFDSPFYQRHLPMDWFWETAQPVLIGSATASVLSPTAQILHLCGHLLLHHRLDCAPESGEARDRHIAHHRPALAASSAAAPENDGAGRLLWLYDVAETALCYREQLSWGDVCAQAEACALTISLQRVLSQVAAEFPGLLERCVLERVEALNPTPSEARVVGRLLAPRRPVLQRFWADLASMHGWRRRLSYAWRSAFPSRRYMRERYAIRHSWLTPLYYPYRWLRGVADALAPRHQQPGSHPHP